MKESGQGLIGIVIAIFFLAIAIVVIWFFLTLALNPSEIEKYLYTAQHIFSTGKDTLVQINNFGK